MGWCKKTKYKKPGLWWGQIILLNFIKSFFNYLKVSNGLDYNIFEMSYCFKDYGFDKLKLLKLKLSIFLKAESKIYFGKVTHEKIFSFSNLKVWENWRYLNRVVEESWKNLINW